MPKMGKGVCALTRHVFIFSVLMGGGLSLSACGGDTSAPSKLNDLESTKPIVDDSDANNQTKDKGSVYNEPQEEEPKEPSDPNNNEPPVVIVEPGDDPIEQPDEPKIPVDPVVPIEPQEPIEPQNPTEPESPIEPENPKEPREPETPEEPEQPKEPEEVVELLYIKVVCGQFNLQIGESVDFSAKAYYSDGAIDSIDDASWSVSNPAVLDVVNGRLQAVGTGSAKLSATWQGKSASINISVLAAQSDAFSVFFKKPETWSGCYIYFWEVEPKGILEKPEWSSSPAMEELTDRWCQYDFPEEATSANIIFKDNSNKTDNLSRSSIGWYMDAKWYDIDPRDDVTAPVVSSFPEPGKHEDTALNVILNIEDQDPDSKIYYRLDDNQASASDTLYSGAITLSDKGNDVDGTISVLAIDSAGNSAYYIFNYYLNEDATAPEVTASLPAANYPNPQNMTISATDNQDDSPTVFYTTDGSEPTVQSPMYDNQNISLVDGSNTIRALAMDDAGNSELFQFKYYIGTPPARADFREETIYFLMPTRFYDGDPSNNFICWEDRPGGIGHNPDSDPCWRGDLVGLIDKLDYIKALGFSAVWITPPVKNASSYDYHGYHAIDFTEIDPRFDSNGNGSAMDEYQDLIDAVHETGMKLIQDIVLNHTSNFGEENIFPLFEKDGNGDYKNIDDPDAVIPNDYMRSVEPNYSSIIPPQQYGARINAMKMDSNDVNHIYHHEKTISWSGYPIQTGQIAGDCVDINTENPVVQDYLIEAYNKYIDMGVDSFRVDTVKHISRLMFNEIFIPAFRERGGDNFFIFGENAARYRGRWSEGVPAISPSFYTWAENESWSVGDRGTNEASAEAHFSTYSSDYVPPVQGTPNHKLEGNNYHQPDWSMRSYLDQIDFPMHWAFKTAHEAFAVARDFDDDFNDATFNVTYVDSHDYAPDGAPEGQRFSEPQDVWAENLSLMFTFRGIPTIYYGSEIEFMKEAPIDKGPTIALAESGRAYMGAHLEGSVTATDFSEYTASGPVADSLAHPLAQHLMALNKIRRAVPALQKGQYSLDGVNGGLAFKRRYTDAFVDSMALVVVSGSATFNDVPDGTWVDIISGDTQTGTSVTANAGGKGSLRVYVLNGEKLEGLSKGDYLK